VCGADTTFAFNSWAVPGDMKREWEAAGLDDALVARESLYCRTCCASLRVRRLAEVLVLHYGEGSDSAARLVDENAFGELAVAEINAAGALHAVLQRHPRLHYSEFRAHAAPGALVDGVRNEDVSALTYDDASLDLVITADTLEHVPDYRQALREIRRVLRSGGRHIFTVPAMPGRRETRTRATLDADGAIRFAAPAQYHGRGSGPLALASPARSDFLAYHDFGTDLMDELETFGFRAERHSLEGVDPDRDAAIVFCCEAV
jgi:SAM-dependent methyltransferase